MAMYKTETINSATTKVVDAGWHQIQLRGIGAKYVPAYSSHMPSPYENIAAGWICFAVFISISA